jgi:hypothetical protein
MIAALLAPIYPVESVGFAGFHWAEEHASEVNTRTVFRHLEEKTI